MVEIVQVGSDAMGRMYMRSIEEIVSVENAISSNNHKKKKTFLAKQL